MKKVTRRVLLQSSLLGVVAMGVPALAAAVARKGRIRQSVCRWCYSHISVDQLAA